MSQQRLTQVLNQTVRLKCFSSLQSVFSQVSLFSLPLRRCAAKPTMLGVTNMQRLLALLIVLTITACGASEPHINADLRPSVERYLSYMPSKGNWDALVSVDWGDKDVRGEGVCVSTHNNLKQREYKVRIAYSMQGKHSALDAAVAHELAHCLHAMPHDDTTFGLMNTIILTSDETWDKYYEPLMVKHVEKYLSMHPEIVKQ